MSTHSKPRSVEPAQQFRDMAEKDTERSKEVYDNASAAATEATAALQSCWTNAFRGMQEYSSKLAEFAQDNTKAQLEFMQKLAGLRTPTEFFEVSTKQMQQQLERLTEQGKLLTALAQRVSLETAEPIKSGLAKAQQKAA